MAGVSPSQRSAEKSRSTSVQKSTNKALPRTRNSTSAETGRLSTDDLLSDPAQAVKDPATARSYLASAEYLPSTVQVTVSQLVGVLALLATDKSVNKQASNVIRAVAILLQSKDVSVQALLIANAVSEQLESMQETDKDDSSPAQRTMAEIERGITESLTKQLEEGLEGIRKHVTDAVNSIVIPPPPPAQAPTLS